MSMNFYQEIDEPLEDRPWMTIHSTHEFHYLTWEHHIKPLLEKLEKETGAIIRIERHPLDAAKAGFDLSNIDPDKWQLICDTMGFLGVEKTEKGFVWRFPNGKVVTSDNPLTGGNFSQPGIAERLGSTGYVGVEGNVIFVKYFCKWFSHYANFIKNSEWGKRSYI